MTGRYYIEVNKKKDMLKRWINSNEEYNSKAVVVKVLYIFALIILVVCISFPAIELYGKRTMILGILAGLAVGLIFAAIPFFMGQSRGIKLRKEFGFPFNIMERELLVLYEDGLEFMYHNVSNRYPESMDVYRIPKEKINAVKYDSTFHIITIIGEGELLAYDDYAAKRLNYQNSQREFYSNSPYTFMALFENEAEIVSAIKGMANYK